MAKAGIWAKRAGGGLQGEILALTSLVPTAYNDIQLVYSGDNLTSVIYRNAGAVVATLSLTYSGDRLTRVVRS